MSSFSLREFLADVRERLSVAAVDLAKRRVGARGVRDGAVHDVEAAEHLLAADEQLGLAGSVGRDRVDARVAAVLGSVWTTFHLVHERKAAEILGIPYDDVTQVALIPVAYTLGTDFKPGKRNPLDTMVHWDQW